MPGILRIDLHIDSDGRAYSCRMPGVEPPCAQGGTAIAAALSPHPEPVPVRFGGRSPHLLPTSSATLTTQHTGFAGAQVTEGTPLQWLHIYKPSSDMQVLVSFGTMRGSPTPAISGLQWKTLCVDGT